MLILKCVVRSLFVVLLFFVSSCNNNPEQTKRVLNTKKAPFDLNEIRERGKLVAITNYNSTDYFVYKGEPMGYQIDMLKLLATFLDVKLEVIVSNDIEENINKLKNGECDLIAANLTVTKDRRKVIKFTEAHSQTRQVLVQRKPDGWEKLSKSQLDKELIRNQIDLGGKAIYVQKKSSHVQRLKNLSDEIGDNINIVEMGDFEAEEIIELVVNGEIDYTVCDENVALVNKTYYPELDVATAVSFPQKLAWAVRKDSPELLTEINMWMIGFKNTKKYARLYNKYFKNSKSAHIVQSDYYSVAGGDISRYDNAIKTYSKEVGWDWRLLASLIYQESRFNPEARSWAGAYGLMQLMPNTARRFGVDTLSAPRENIAAGVKFIKWIDTNFLKDIENEDERLKFIIASYNVGPGHIMDARRLAEKYGKNPDVWTGNVDFYILQKSKPRYYLDDVVKYGYCRGSEPYHYVADILERYDHYKNVVKEE